MYPLMSCKEKGTSPLVFSIIRDLSLITSDQPKLRDILQNFWPVLFKSVRVTNDKERLRNRHRLEETKETWRLNAVQFPRSDPGTEKRPEQKAETIQEEKKKSVDELIELTKC